MDWEKSIADVQQHLAESEKLLQFLGEHREKSVADIAQYLRVGKGIELDLDAIRETLKRPYTIIPINEHEAWLVQWRGVKIPVFGWVVAVDGAFLKARVTRSMDLLTPLPSWMKDELGWKPPAHGATIDANRTGVQLTAGDESSFKRKYGQHLGGKRADGTFAIKGGDAWIKLVAAMVRDGILPYAPQPVAADHWRKFNEYPKLLQDLVERQQSRAGDDYINRGVREFRERGAVLANLPPGAGKTLLGGIVLNHFVGRVLVLGDSTMLVDQWTERLEVLAPDRKCDVTVSTYQGAGKYLAEEWDLIIFDEAQRLPANTFSKLAFVKTKYRLGLTGTPWREDDKQFLIVALAGFPVAVRWAELVNAGVLRRPSITVATVANEAAKVNYVKQLVAKRKGRTMIFCDWLEQGQALADALDVPFISGSSARKLQQLQEAEVSVVSRVADRGVSLSDIRLVIEVAGQGSAREQFGQRVGRLLHGEYEGEFVTIFTPEEAIKYRGRVFGVEAELAGQVDIQFINVGNVPDQERSVAPKRSAAPRALPAQQKAAAPPAPSKPKDEIDLALELPAVVAKIKQVKASTPSHAHGYIERAFRYTWKAALEPKEFGESKGTLSEAIIRRWRTACEGLVEVGLMVKVGARFKVNREEVDRLEALSAMRR